MGIRGGYVLLPGNFFNLCCKDSATEAWEPVRKSLKSPRHVYNSTCDCLKCDNIREMYSIPRDSELSPLELQSAAMSETDKTLVNETQTATVQFADSDLSQEISMGDFSSGNYDHDNDATAGIGDFFSRPVRIASFNWTEAVGIAASYNPWALYFNSPGVKKKLDNYSRLRCKLHLKFVVNASPFYYGSLRACYFPLPDQRANYQGSTDQVPYSQVPGVYLEPQNMSSAEMTLPFLWPFNWLDAGNHSQLINMGSLQFITYANLNSANGVTGASTRVTIYAWAEDLELAGPTTGLALQSTAQDEYDTKGVISQPASVVANIAGRLTDVPVIGPFARATEIGAGALANVARIFGFSNPPMLDNVHGFQNKSFHAFANVDTRMPIDKLAMDAKNEVTISPKVAGIDEEDPLVIKNIVTRDSFLQGTAWTQAQATNTLLWSAMVNPGLSISSTYYTTTPMGYFCNMFRYWRGSIIFKFRFIKSRYHTGRVLIAWDPNKDITGVTSEIETLTLSKIVDIELEDEIEFAVPYKAIFPYLQTRPLSPYLSNGASPSFPTSMSDMYNGCITMRVLNTLTGPADNASINVLVNVRAGDDFMFAVPKAIGESVSISDPTGVIQSEPTVDQKSPKLDEQISLITTGENIISIRPLLHRTTHNISQELGNPYVNTANAGVELLNTNCYWRIPRGYGRDPNGYSNALVSSVNVPYSYCRNNYIDWTLNCFVGVRGSTNMQFNVLNPSLTAANVEHLSVERLYVSPVTGQTGNRNGNTAFGGAAVTAAGYQSSQALGQSAGNWNNTVEGSNGMSLTNTATQSALGVNIPQYSNSRFTLAFKTVRENNLGTAGSTYDAVQLHTKYRSVSATPTSNSGLPVVEVYYSAGVDFNPIFFLCTPRFWSVGVPPSPNS